MTYRSSLYAVVFSLVAFFFLPLLRLHADLTREQLAAAKSATGFLVTSEGN